MKLTTYLTLSIRAIVMLTQLIHTADDDNILYQSISVDHSSDDDIADISISNMYNGGIRPINQTLNFSKRELSTIHDLAQYRHALALTTLTTIKINKNKLQNHDLNIALSTIPSLTTVDIGYNKISSLDNLPTHDKLEILLINNNKITKINIGTILNKLPSLQQVTFHDNPLESVTNITSLNKNVRELWFNHDTLDDTMIAKFIQTFPNLTAELMPGSRAVQKYYSIINNNYDTFKLCDWDCCSCCNNGSDDDCKKSACLNNASCIFIAMPLIGAITGLTIAGITMEAQNPIPSAWNSNDYNALSEHRTNVFNLYCSILIPSCAVGFSLATRGLHRLYRYCTTKPEDRYETVHTRIISAQPQLLNLIEDVVDPIPSQEDEQL